MSLDLQLRKCLRKNCGNTFSVLPSSPQHYCSTAHKLADDDEGIDKKEKKQRILKRAQNEWRHQSTNDIIYTSPKNQKQETSETTALYGTQELGGRPLHSRKDESRKNNTGSETRSKLVKQNNAEKDTTPTRTLETKKLSVGKRNTEKIKIKKLKDENYIGKTIKTPTTNIKGNTMQKTESNNSTELSKQGTGQTQLSGSQELSTLLNEERSGSINLLQDTSEHLINLGHSVAQVVYDDDDEIIRKPAAHEVDQAIKCFSAANELMKTKLEHLKFAKELLK